MKFLYIPYEKNAPERKVTINISGTETIITTKVAVKNIDAFMCLPFQGMLDKIHTADGNDTLIRAAFVEDEERCDTDISIRPILHMTPATGAFTNIKCLEKKDGIWDLTLQMDPTSQTGQTPIVQRRYQSNDLIHWRVQDTMCQNTDCIIETPHYWLGDVCCEKSSISNDGRNFIVAISKPNEAMPVPLSNFLSIPAVYSEEGLKPARELQNLRVWKRYWQCETIEKSFEFEARFQVVPYPGNSEWPKMSFRESTSTLSDIRAQAVEAELELFVGQERFIEIDFCGLKWRWNAYTAILEREDGLQFDLKPDKGRISFHLFSDLIAQELFMSNGKACISSLPCGRGTVAYNNPETTFFRFSYQREPYIKINTPGSTAKLIELNFYGLRRAGYSPDSEKVVNKMVRGELLYQGKNFRVYENCIEDDIYGDPATWVTQDGNQIYSPVRLVEDFQEPQNKWWRNKSRVTERNDCFRAPNFTDKYPVLETRLPVLSAAYKVAVDVLMRDVSEEYCLPGEEGLLAASLEQGPGAGGGMWVRDTNQAAFRSMNLLCPSDIRKSLSEVVKRGIANGSDGAAMPAIGIWDYYLATGDKTLLFETLSGVIRNANETDLKFDKKRNLVPAEDVLDAIPEPELNDGFCFATNVFYAHMYLCTAKICQETDAAEDKREHWLKRGRSMIKTLREEYWNERCGCFSNGPKGSVYYQNGWWESTGAELSIWPRFCIADSRQRQKFLHTIKSNPRAFTDFGINMFPYKSYGNFFWNQVWTAWEQGIAVAAVSEGDMDFLNSIIFQQIRNCVTTRDFHECIDADTGRAWSWPGLAWHAAGFLGYLVNAVLGISYDEEGMRITPAVPEKLKDIGISNLKYRKMTINLLIKGFGKIFDCTLDGMPFTGAIPNNLDGEHTIIFTSTSQ